MVHVVSVSMPHIQAGLWEPQGHRLLLTQESTGYLSKKITDNHF